MTKTSQTLLAFLALGLTIQAAPLSTPTAVHTQPNSNAAVVTVLSAGTEPTTALPDPTRATAAGWMAVTVAGPFEAYVQNKDIDKGLHVKTGAAIHLQPSTSSGVLTTMELGDKTSITGLHGKWTQINVDKRVIGYIKVGSTGPGQNQAPDLVSSAQPAYNAGYPQPAAAIAAPTVLPAGANETLPRLFQGQFVSTRRPFTPRRPHDWQLNDEAGVRYAYLDISKLLLTDQIENYADREVVVYGMPKAMADGKNIVIQVENMRLK